MTSTLRNLKPDRKNEITQAYEKTVYMFINVSYFLLIFNFLVHFLHIISYKPVGKKVKVYIF